MFEAVQVEMKYQINRMTSLSHLTQKLHNKYNFLQIVTVLLFWYCAVTAPDHFEIDWAVASQLGNWIIWSIVGEQQLCRPCGSLDFLPLSILLSPGDEKQIPCLQQDPTSSVQLQHTHAQTCVHTHTHTHTHKAQQSSPAFRANLLPKLNFNHLNEFSTTLSLSTFDEILSQCCKHNQYFYTDTVHLISHIFNTLLLKYIFLRRNCVMF